MSTATQQFHAILFADIAGSVRLHEQIGDDAAHQVIRDVQKRMTEVAGRYAGKLVKTIGDEMLCRFPTAELGITACIAMQEAISAEENLPTPLQFRMGLHWGPVILEGREVLGDAVSVAARLSAIARAGQIVLSGVTTRSLPSHLADNIQLLDITRVKSNLDGPSLYEVRWQPEIKPAYFSAPATDTNLSVEKSRIQLTLYYLDQEHVMELGEIATIGRADDCHISLINPLASRIHARIESRSNKFVFIDLSTNGSYVQTEDNDVVYLRKNEFTLWGEGKILVGEDNGEDESGKIRFRIGYQAMKVVGARD